MDLESRHRAIISAVELQGTVRVAELAKQLSVTKMTIRRDLSLLERQGLLKRVHGGGISARGRSYEPTLALRNTVHVLEKQRIARCAADLILEGDFVALDVGSSTFELARLLAERRNLTVITPSLWIANVLANLPGLRLILPGGIVRPGEASMIGELSHRALEMFHVDRLFLGVGGIDSTAGLTEYNWDDTQVKQAMLKTAKQVIALADGSKFERIATVKIAPLETLDMLVTDQAPPAALADALQEAGVKVIIAR
jgi:DeoR/GlpR family transcriptional regulator of sugar metabolism